MLGPLDEDKVSGITHPLPEAKVSKFGGFSDSVGVYVHDVRKTIFRGFRHPVSPGNDKGWARHRPPDAEFLEKTSDEGRFPGSEIAREGDEQGALPLPSPTLRRL